MAAQDLEGLIEQDQRSSCLLVSAQSTFAMQVARQAGCTRSTRPRRVQSRAFAATKPPLLCSAPLHKYTAHVRPAGATSDVCESEVRPSGCGHRLKRITSLVLEMRARKDLACSRFCCACTESLRCFSSSPLRSSAGREEEAARQNARTLSNMLNASKHQAASFSLPCQPRASLPVKLALLPLQGVYTLAPTIQRSIDDIK